MKVKNHVEKAIRMYFIGKIFHDGDNWDSQELSGLRVDNAELILTTKNPFVVLHLSDGESHVELGLDEVLELM